MPNEYSIEIHRYLSTKIAEIEQQCKDTRGASPGNEGQLAELYWIRKYLEEHIDLKDFIYY